jgi:hypothetical protein
VLSTSTSLALLNKKNTFGSKTLSIHDRREQEADF